jgi:hypothetical protein
MTAKWIKIKFKHIVKPCELATTHISTTVSDEIKFSKKLIKEIICKNSGDTLLQNITLLQSNKIKLKCVVRETSL